MRGRCIFAASENEMHLNRHIRTSMFSLLLSWIGAAGADVFAEAATVHVARSFKIHLISVPIPGTDGTTQQVWKIDLQRLAKDLRAINIGSDTPDSQIQSAMLNRLAEEVARRLKAGLTALPPFIVWATPPNVNGSLEFTLPPATVTEDQACEGSAELLPDPTAGAAPQCREVKLEADLTPIRAIQIALRSEDTTDPLPPINKTYSEIASQLHLKPHPDDNKIAVSIQLSSHDQIPDHSSEQRASLPLFVVSEVRQMLSDLGFGIGTPGGDGFTWGPWENISDTLAALSAPYTLLLPGMPLRSVAVSLTMPENTLLVDLQSVKFTHDVDFRAAAGASPDAVDAVRSHHADRVRKRIAGDVPRSQDLARLVYELKTDPYVKDVHLSFDRRLLVVTVETQTVLKRVALTMGGGYKAETNFFGTFAAALENVAGLTDKIETSVALSPHIADVALSGSIPETPHPFGRGFYFLGLTLAGKHLFNNNAHFQRAGADQNTDRQNLLTGIAKLGFDSFSAHDLLVWPDVSLTGRAKARHLLTLSPGYEIGSLSVTDKQTKQTVTSGGITALSIQPVYLFDWDLRSAKCQCGLSQFRAQFESLLVKGVRKLGADFGYDSASASVTLELSFGVHSPYQFLVRGRGGAAMASRGTPLERLFRIGGSDYVRGLEKGEFTANTLVWQQYEAGINFPTLLSWLRAMARRPASAPGNSAGPQLPFDLQTSYVEVFLDHARTSQGTSLHSSVPSGRALDGYGVLAELGKLQNRINLSLGYGRSPQSTLRRHGVFLIGVTLR